ncbi:DUF5813 family protein [Halobacteria archaeon AArc-curdl1]|uniref:DUF5813 family protein n=1 Tax=Natronosalvus hydrolyticus TaxID=2979988 RepID=A0AAP3E890_9EURY|nr:DUF5813 family protein [Halobacteria archaeon AArc-curdl1]
MNELPEAMRVAFDSHDAFARADDSNEADGGYRLETTVFETAITAGPAEGKRDGEISVTITLPTLDAASEDHVAPVVEEGWFDTFERRLEDVFTVADTGTHELPTIEYDADAGDVRVTLEYVSWDGRTGVEDAKALIEYVEGTYAQGLVPGYTYRGPAETLLTNAQQSGDAADNEPSL